MRRFALIAAVLGGISPIFVLPASAQSRPAAVVECPHGWAGFADDSVIHHSVVGAAARFICDAVRLRISVGPEITYLRGPGSDRDLIVTGNLTPGRMTSLRLHSWEEGRRCAASRREPENRAAPSTERREGDGVSDGMDISWSCRSGV